MFHMKFPGSFLIPLVRGILPHLVLELGATVPHGPVCKVPMRYSGVLKLGKACIKKKVETACASEGWELEAGPRRQYEAYEKVERKSSESSLAML